MKKGVAQAQTKAVANLREILPASPSPGLFGCKSAVASPAPAITASPWRAIAAGVSQRADNAEAGYG